MGSLLEDSGTSFIMRLLYFLSVPLLAALIVLSSFKMQLMLHKWIYICDVVPVWVRRYEDGLWCKWYSAPPSYCTLDFQVSVRSVPAASLLSTSYHFLVQGRQIWEVDWWKWHMTMTCFQCCACSEYEFGKLQFCRSCMHNCCRNTVSWSLHFGPIWEFSMY